MAKKIVDFKKIVKADREYAYYEGGWSITHFFGFFRYRYMYAGAAEPIPLSALDKPRFHEALNQYWDHKLRYALENAKVIHADQDYATLDSGWKVCLKEGFEKNRMTRGDEDIPLLEFWEGDFLNRLKHYHEAEQRKAVGAAPLAPQKKVSYAPYVLPDPEPKRAPRLLRHAKVETALLAYYVVSDKEQKRPPSPETLHARYTRAVWLDHPRIIDYAINNGIHPDTVVKIGGVVASGLSYSARAGNDETLKRLREKGARRLNPVDKGEALFLRMIDERRATPALILAATGPDVFDEDETWNTVLQEGRARADKYGYHEIAGPLATLIKKRETMLGISPQQYREPPPKLPEAAARPQFAAVAPRALPPEEPELDIHIEEVELVTDSRPRNDVIPLRRAMVQKKG